MKCGIKYCVQSDNRHLWKCWNFVTCQRMFHASCIGAQRNHEEVLRTFMLPLCHECQEELTTHLDLKALIIAQNKLHEDIGKTLEANHKLLSNFKRLSATHDETLEFVEQAIGEIKQHTLNAANSSNAGVAELKKIKTTLVNIPSDSAVNVEAIAKSAATEVMKITTTTSTVPFNELFSTLKNDLADSHAALTRDVKSQIEEVTKKIRTPSNKDQHNCESNSGWRFINWKKIWRSNWDDYDLKMRRRQIQEKQKEKAVRRRRQRKRNHHNHSINNTKNTTSVAAKYKNNNNKHTSNNNSVTQRNSSTDQNQNKNYISERIAIPSSSSNSSSEQMQNKQNISSRIVTYNNRTNNNNNNSNIGSNSSNNENINYHKNTLPLDKELLAAAKVQFSGTPKFINFQKGETINPYRVEKPPLEHPPLVDPICPPIVRLTAQSANGDKRFLKARLRDPRILEIVRMYLSYLHDQPASVCIRGTTKTNATIMLAAEGLPTDITFLREIFLDVHSELGVSAKEALADLQSYRAFLTSERTQRLQQTREAANKFYRPFPRH